LDIFANVVFGNFAGPGFKLTHYRKKMVIAAEASGTPTGKLLWYGESEACYRIRREKGPGFWGGTSLFGVPSASSGQALRLRLSQKARQTPLRMAARW
jgi:hypothetical protein